MEKTAKYYYRKYAKDPKWKARKNAYMRKWYQKNRQRWLDYKRKDAYGPNGPAHFREHLRKQKKRCAICGRKMTKPNQDHNHKTKKLRGVLCNWCNTGLAFIENRRWLLKATKYLRVWK